MSAGIFAIPTVRACSPSSGERATTKSVGSAISFWLARQKSRISRATGTLSSSRKRLPDREADRAHEVVGHAAAEEERVGAPREDPQRVDLARDLRAAQDRGERALRLEETRELADLLLEEEPGALHGHERRHARHGGVGAMRRAERVIDVDVREGGQLLRERGVVRLLARVEAQVLEEQDFAGRELSREVLDLGPHAVVRESHGTLEESGELDRDRRERELRFARSLRLSQVGGAEDARSAVDGVPDRRQGLDDPRRVGHPAAVERNVEVDPEKDSPPLDRQVRDRLHGRSLFVSPVESPDAPSGRLRLPNPAGPRGPGRRGGSPGRRGPGGRRRRGGRERREGGDRHPAPRRKRGRRGGRCRVRARGDLAGGRQHRRAEGSGSRARRRDGRSSSTSGKRPRERRVATSSSSPARAASRLPRRMVPSLRAFRVRWTASGAPIARRAAFRGRPSSPRPSVSRGTAS